VADELIEAYRNTDYRCGVGAHGFTLRIGVRSEPLARLCASTGCASAVFITAYNPFSQTQSDAVNQAAHARLGADLHALGRPVFDGAGADPSGNWPVEPSYLVLGVDLDAAKTLGMQYQQNAIVWMAADAVAVLVLLR
jgi:hypothetical protein